MSISITAPVESANVPQSAPTRIVLSDAEVADIRVLIADLKCRYTSTESPEFLEEADVVSHEIPRRLRKVLRDFRLHEPSGALCAVVGWPVDQAKIGPTPSHWNRKEPLNQALDEEILLVLCGSLLGDLIAWSTQQDGRVLHDVLPIRGHEHEQLGTGSEELLTWHVEDAHHPYRGDYLGLMCLRNPDCVPTTFASIARAGLSRDQVDLLSEPHFTIRPDESHRPKNRGDASMNTLLERAYAKIERMIQSPEKLAVLFGDREAPYVRLDPYFMRPVKECPRAQAALDGIVAQIDAVLEDLVLKPGDIYFIDNYQAVHGRKPFQARFDGTDRWLKRINVARDLRKSRDARQSPGSRLIY